MNKKANNRHVDGNGNGKFGKKEARILRSLDREPRSMEDRMKAAGNKERVKLGLSK